MDRLNMVKRHLEENIFYSSPNVIQCRYQFYFIGMEGTYLAHGEFLNHSHKGNLIAKGLHKDNREVGFWIEDVGYANKWVDV